MSEFQKVADYILGISKLSQPQLREHLLNSEIDQKFDEANLVVSKIIKNLYTQIEKKLIERLKFMGFQINEETAKRITRIDQSENAEFRHEFWIDYNTDQRQFLFLVYSDYQRGMICFEHAKNKPLGGTPITGGEIILKKPSN